MPLRQVLHRPDTAGCLLKWSIKLGQFSITFAPETAIKAQVLADFLVELMFPKKIGEVVEGPWELYVDGSSTNTRAWVEIILISSSKQSFTITIKFNFTQQTMMRSMKR